MNKVIEREGGLEVVLFFQLVLNSFIQLKSTSNFIKNKMTELNYRMNKIYNFVHCTHTTRNKVYYILCHFIKFEVEDDEEI